MTTNNQYDKKVRISGKLVFDTAFHIGSGREGELATDMGVLLDPDGFPVLPGSTLKGSFRTFAERLAVYLNQTACLLDSRLSGVDCVGDEAYRRKQHEDFKAIGSEAAKLAWLEIHTCPICRLFGSPYQGSRIFFTDGTLESGGRNLQIRDGVSIDRDTETARYGFKYDFEVVPPGAVFSTLIDIDNPSDMELALVAAVLAEWENGFRLGGFTSRGLGHVRFTERQVSRVEYGDKDALLDYLVSRKMADTPDLLDGCLTNALNQ